MAAAVVCNPVLLCLVTDRRRLAGRNTGAGAACDGWRACLNEQARFAVTAGVDLLQVRERDLDARDLAAVVGDLVRLSRGSRTRVVVNDRLDVALACGADGVHLRADSMSPAVIRRMTPDGFLVGRSVHGAEEAAAAAGVDYVIAGSVWPTASKPAGHQLLGLSGFS